ncbi:MAG: hypothetical protein A2Y77_10335 [Planctomycetes bacterium RBG_13_62_9]|nr:MAG: hypothetical protein A2Y77_10335 [Planctomycetes bacterium RBG_13_62_9]
MKFPADMGISPRTVDFLQHQGHEAIHLHQQELDRLKDSEILEKARRERCILLTHDLDFGDLLAASGADLPSVVIFRLRNMQAERVNCHLRTIISHYSQALEKAAIISVSERQVRSRGLPLRTSE